MPNDDELGTGVVAVKQFVRTIRPVALQAFGGVSRRRRASRPR
jgi:hypothetical protein